MKKFDFKLQKLLEYRRGIEDKLLGELAAIRAEHEREMIMLQQMTKERNSFREKMKHQLSKGSAEDIMQAYHYLNELSRRLEGQKITLRQVGEQRDNKTSQVVEAAKDRKALERLREHKRAEYRRELEADEQKFLDDIACIRHRSNNATADRVSGGVAA